ncbi:MAG: DUF2723 domain-containing protein [Bacteroidales bacterium]|jgi:hypothetical protein|nr:DUF2723 domain-containing protein [Bacteroidales bacterium]
MIKNYSKLNQILGWLVWAIATFVYISTAERTVPWWDCGEYISTAFRQMVGHPPGAPTFQILGSLACLFTFGDLTKVAFAVNSVSALCSSFTILFLFWTITMIGKKLVNAINKGEQASPAQLLMIFASAIVGSLAYTFSDTFWFSAVEGEVYAMSSFFTAITFWAILKWEEVADEKHHLRWIIFIAFLVGLAIGVHLLNLLVIPAIVFIVYYKKFEHTRKNFWWSMIISFVLVGVILWGIVPWIVKLAGYFELAAVNGFGLPFNTGTILYFVVLIGAIAWGILYSHKKQKAFLNTMLLCFVFILIGYSTFLTLVIRSNRNDLPLNENEPKNALSLLAYLNREQYGSRPFLYGQYFNARVESAEEVSPKYEKDIESGKYVNVGNNVEYKYDNAHTGVFPRMYSNSEGGGRPHVQYYRFWSGTKADANTAKPTFGENMRFFLRYQVGWMYMRYFMWNFVGRQNNEQGLGYNGDGSRDIYNGNWISGVKFLDEMRLGPQSNLPDFLKNNQARNTLFFLPLLLGLIGVFFHYKKAKKDFFVVVLLFFMTGLAIVIYLNEPSTEPRERDYTYAGSFYAFAIWIGLGVMAISTWLAKRMKPIVATSLVFVVTLFAVPVLMASQEWDDHDRSNRTAAYDYAKNSLMSCDENAILIANGDNDTFPLWYCQFVENFRNDVRILNSALAGSYWHVQPLFRKLYDSSPVKMSISYNNYGQGKNDYVWLENRGGEAVELEDILKFVNSDDPRSKQMSRNGESINIFPTKKVKITVPTEKLLAEGIITQEQASRIVPVINWELKNSSNAIYKNDLAFLDVIGTNRFERPICLMSDRAQQEIYPVPQLAEMQGAVYKFVPYINPNREAIGNNGVNTGKSYDLFVNKFRWGNLQDAKTAVDPESAGYSRSIKYSYIQLANALSYEGKKDSAVVVLDKIADFFPHSKVAYDGIMLYVVESYLKAGAIEKAAELAKTLQDIYRHRLDYARSFPSKYAPSLKAEINECGSIFYSMNEMLAEYESDVLIGGIYAENESILQMMGVTR